MKRLKINTPPKGTQTLEYKYATALLIVLLFLSLLLSKRSVGIAACYGPDGEGPIRGRFNNLFQLHSVQTDSRARTAYITSIEGDFSGSKAAGA
jgi:hypothetical protein